MNVETSQSMPGTSVHLKRDSAMLDKMYEPNMAYFKG